MRVTVWRMSSSEPEGADALPFVVVVAEVGGVEGVLTPDPEFTLAGVTLPVATSPKFF